ncbi:hypothetical protein J4573_04010 [Actinomadura barringtoniae]|uniref:Terpene synthase n=1 Tax=Actinomadura barringtoniae TaxID=1427535 RepID=A0A939T0U9_9ACTN|nr:hypothetical protein [Actinomadura barringtoniae]MBO2446241.1 hypothetical protein [Actinomadura barringtoniae]
MSESITTVMFIVDVSLLLSLTDRVPALGAPSVLHPDAWPLGERLEAWSRARGLVLGDPDTSPLGRARFERLAARVFPTAELDRVELFARWLTWAFALDDAIDEAPLGTSATAVDALFEDLLKAVRRGHARPGAMPLEATGVELWRATVPGMSRDWRRRFLMHLEEHRAGCAEEAVNRRMGQVPGLDDYPALRRRAAAPFLFDLIEPVLGVELPPSLRGTPSWKALLEGTADVLAWCNDVASHARESARGDVHNQVTVLAEAYGFETPQAAGWVIDHVAHRVGDVQAGARMMGDDLDRLRLSPEQRSASARVVRALLDAPRAHLDWLTESGRYRPPGSDLSIDGMPMLVPGQRKRLDGLASLR